MLREICGLFSKKAACELTPTYSSRAIFNINEIDRALGTNGRRGIEEEEDYL